MAEHATQAIIGWGSQLQRGDGADPEVFVNITEVISFDAPDEQADDIEVSHFESPDRTKEYIAGMIEAGEASFSVNYNPGVYPSHQQITADKASGVVSNWRFMMPTDNGSVVETITFPAYVKGFKPNTAPNDALTADVTLKVAGSVTRTNPTLT